MADASMSNRPVIVGIDGSDASLNALRQGIAEAKRRETALHVVHVLDVTPAILHLHSDVTITTRDLAESDRAEVWKTVEPILAEADGEVVRVELEGDPSQELIDYCAQAGAAVLVLGPRGRGRMEKLILGSTAEAAMRSAVCDVLLVKSEA